MRKKSLYIMAAFYIVAGLGHLVMPDFYLMLMPKWFPWPIPVIIFSGIAEVALAVALVKQKTRKLAAWLIIAMLVFYLFINHVPMAMDYFEYDHAWFIGSLIRVVLQLPLIWWAYTFTKDPEPDAENNNGSEAR